MEVKDITAWAHHVECTSFEENQTKGMILKSGLGDQKGDQCLKKGEDPKAKKTIEEQGAKYVVSV